MPNQTNQLSNAALRRQVIRAVLLLAAFVTLLGAVSLLR
jgi:hypothetical protein